MISKFSVFIAALTLVVVGAPALTVTVDPAGGGDVLTIAAAFASVEAQADASNTINLVSTSVHSQPVPTTWSLNPSPESVIAVTVQSADLGQPVVLIEDDASTRFLTTISSIASGTITYDGIAFIPEAGQSYANNNGDALQISGGNHIFTDCVFSANDGADGVLAQDAETADFVSGNNVGDDWMQAQSGTGDLTFSNCAISGSWDDAILIGSGAAAPGGSHTLTLDAGTAIANTGGAGIQVFGSQTNVVCDGSAGRVQIVDNGQRSGASDVAIKFFWDVGCSIDLDQTDLINSTNGTLWDFEGVTPIDITDSRIAFGNSGDASPSGIIPIWDLSADSAYQQNISITRATLHDCLASAEAQNGIYAEEGATQPYQSITIIDSIFSGAGDLYDAALNNTGAGAASVTQSFSLVVENGPHAVANVGELAGAAYNVDPQYLSEFYFVGRSQDNINFLRPTNPALIGAASDGSDLTGGSPATTVPVELSIFTTN